ncbi:MAG: CHASE domain-containing protein [Opitutaceae bacterium]|nr:CHASE domain-containing protein [Opitutaceae bacterium]MBP9913711.1 CHASE domain-containing protein [Opitutaceae bacterium]
MLLSTMSPTEPAFLLRRRFAVAGIAVVGVLLSLYSFHWMQRNDAARAEAEFVRRATIRNAMSQQVIDNFEARLFGLRHLFIGSEEVTRAEFAAAAGDILQHYSGITALEWVVIVPEDQRAKLEAEVARELGRPFQFVYRDAASRLVRAPAAAEHLPILYVEPMAGNEAAFGYDLAFGPTLDALQRARATGRMTTSPRVRLVQESSPEAAGLIFIWPVQLARTPPGQIAGFVQGVFRAKDILEESYRLNQPLTLDALYVDPAEKDPAHRVVYYRTPAASPAGGVYPSEAEFRAGVFWESTLTLGDQRWTTLYRPQALWLQAQRQNHPVWWLLGGLIITGLACALIHALGRRTESIEQEVAERTAELSESRRTLESLLQALPGMAFRCTYGTQSAPLYFSAGTLNLTGYAAADFISGQAHVRDLIHPDDLARVRDATRAALQNHRPFELEYRIRTREGAEKWVLSRGHGVYDAGGKMLFYEGLAIDITRGKQAEADKLALERRLLESHKLESLGLLAGGVAHDFNNLLTSIVGNAGLARLDLPEGSSSATHLHQIEVASQHAAELCQQMLAYAGKGRLDMEPLDLNDLLRAMQPLVQPSLNRSANLQLNLAPDLPQVMADGSQLRQVALNLIINASDAIGDRSGTISVTTTFADVARSVFAECIAGHELREGRYVILEVRDNGCGMSADTLARIFDPFFTTKFAGHGLGLAAVLGIVRGHAGALQVRSTPGQGTVFRLMLPAAPATGGGAGSVPSGRSSGRTVLVIDDDRAVCEVTAEVLRSFGHDAVIALNGQDALALFRENPARFDAVLLDVVMPGLSGADTLQRLRAIQPGVRVLMMSGQTESQAMRKLGENGSFHFITKPFTRASLEQKLQELFGA